MPETKLQELSRLLRTQDNRSTHLPVYVVQRRVRDFGIDEEYGGQAAWFPDESRSAVDEESAVKLENHFDETGEDEIETDGGVVRRCTYRDRWETAQSFLTEKGAERYIRANKHNLGATRIYVASGYRNTELEFLRGHLIEVGLSGAERERRTKFALGRVQYPSLAQPYIDQHELMRMTDDEFNSFVERTKR